LAYDFPDSPTVGQVFQAWTWNGEAWVLTLPLNVEYVLKSGDVMGGHLGLPTGPSDSQAVRKDYVDAAIAAIPTPDLSSKVSKSGDTMTGALTVTNDITAQRSWAPTTGYVFVGNGGKYFGFDGTSYVMAGALAWASNGRLWGGSDGTPLWLSGGVMTGQITTPGSQAIGYGGGAGTLEVRASGAGDACMSFHRPGAFACNFGLGTDNNFYFGGWSFGATAYRFWTTRDFNYTPQPSLGFTPVQQNGGAYHQGNKIYIGWDGANLRAQVDATDLGKIATEGRGVGFLSNGRLPHAGDAGISNDGTLREYISHAVITGSAHKVPVEPLYDTGPTVWRLRYVQGYTTGWFTFAYA